MNKEYLSTDIPVSSLTYALKGQKLLEQKGFRVWAGRDHDRIQGCGYKLTVKGDAQRAKQLAFIHVTDHDLFIDHHLFY